MQDEQEGRLARAAQMPSRSQVRAVLGCLAPGLVLLLLVLGLAVFLAVVAYVVSPSAGKGPIPLPALSSQTTTVLGFLLERAWQGGSVGMVLGHASRCKSSVKAKDRGSWPHSGLGGSGALTGSWVWA